MLNVSIGYSQPVKVDSSRVRKLRIDPQMAKGMPASALFKQVKFIPLETTKESMFGEVVRLRVFADRMVIFDHDTWSVLIFNTDGKFINKITEKTIRSLGSGAANPNGVGNAFLTFSITNVGQENFIDIPGKNVVFRFNQDGVFKAKINGYQQLSYPLGGNVEVLSDFSSDGKNCYTFGITSGRDTAKYFPYQLKRYEEEDYFITGLMLNYEQHGERMLFHDYYSYNLFELSKSGVRFKYQIILPGDISVPADFLTNPVYRLKQDQYLSDNRKKVYGLSGCYEIGDYLYFTLSSKIKQQGVKESLAYNLKTGELISLQDIVPDAMSYFLPVNDSSFGHQFLMEGFSFYDPYKNQLYSSIPSATMVMLGKKNAANAKLYPPKLADYFKKADNNNNPVVVVLEPKDGK